VAQHYLIKKRKKNEKKNEKNNNKKTKNKTELNILSWGQNFN